MKKILNCPMEFICRKKWIELQPTDELTIKYCGSCNKEVHFCDTEEGLKTALLNNLCIAFSNDGSDELITPQRHMTLGLPSGYKGFDSLFGGTNEAN
jgi:hypothetical protein